MSEEKVKKEKKPRSKASKIVEWVITGIFSVLFIFVLIGFIDGMTHKKQYYGESIRFGWGTFVVETGSMSDCLPKGCAIFTYHESADKVYEKYVKEAALGDPNKMTINITFFDTGKDNSISYPTNTAWNDRTRYTNRVMTHRLREIHVNEGVKLGEGKYTFYVTGTTPDATSQENQFQCFSEKHYLGIVQGKSFVFGHIFRFISSVWGLLILLLVPACYLVIVSVLDIFKAYKDDDEKVVATQGADGSVIAGESKLNNISASERERLKQELLQEMINKKKADAAKNEKKEEKIDA